MMKIDKKITKYRVEKPGEAPAATPVVNDVDSMRKEANVVWMH